MSRNWRQSHPRPHRRTRAPGVPVLAADGTHMIVLNLVLIGLAITLEPIPLTAFILVLASKGGVRKGAAFIFGWLLSLAIVIAFTVLVTDNKPPKPSTAPSLAALAAKLAIASG